eukprot:4219027-Pleurochrysis_carterae.AAC.1
MILPTAQSTPPWFRYLQHTTSTVMQAIAMRVAPPLRCRQLLAVICRRGARRPSARSSPFVSQLI